MVVGISNIKAYHPIPALNYMSKVFEFFISQSKFLNVPVYLAQIDAQTEFHAAILEALLHEEC